MTDGGDDLLGIMGAGDGEKKRERKAFSLCVCVVLGEIVRDPQFIIPAGSI